LLRLVHVFWHVFWYNAPFDARHAKAAFLSFELYNSDPESDSGFLVICDHASNALPEGYGTLGLAPSEFSRHIAYDIGAAEVSRRLAEALNCPAVLARYSRLLIDLNRGADDPTLVMKLSDGAIIPANREVDAFADKAEFAHRLAAFHEPYHLAVAEALTRARALGAVPAILSIHSFTPSWRGVARPWHTGILWDRDDRLPAVMLAGLRAEAGLVVGDNEPYTGALKGDCLFRHGTQNGLPHVLVEIRQDLIADAAGQAEWAARIARLVGAAAGAPHMSEIKFYGSQTDTPDCDRPD
tara:strand:- start:270 stop:1160 length:891 start_codon:yes stop_codon:yes gene_type:complete